MLAQLISLASCHTRRYFCNYFCHGSRYKREEGTHLKGLIFYSRDQYLCKFWQVYETKKHVCCSKSLMKKFVVIPSIVMWICVLLSMYHFHMCFFPLRNIVIVTTGNKYFMSCFGRWY